MFKYCYIVIVDLLLYIQCWYLFFCYLLMTISTWRRKLEFELNNCKYMLFCFILYTNKYTPWFKWWIHLNLQKWDLLGLGFMAVWRLVLLVKKPDYPEKTTDLSQVTDKLYHTIVVSSTPRLNGVWTHTISGDRHWLHMQL
jgi:hypothetical protein